MSEVVDARGLSCPQPVLMALDAVKLAVQGRMEVLVDTEASRENVSRAVQAKGWRVDVREEGEGFRLVLEK
ncbi:MAG: preprotein translocase subunit TatB [Deltaproteobacteria bacterium]|nr:preprotein translocase subunit TatB [Deltaproteobacteria bacterium]